MNFRVGIENNNEGIRSIAWALEHPGCYAYGKNADEALNRLPAAIRAYSDWINHHGPSWLRAEHIELNVESVWDDYYVNDKLERVPASEDALTVESWFQYDWKPLTADEIERGLKLLEWSRASLLKLTSDLSPEKLDQRYPNERWSISGILRHLGGAEWWYMDGIGKAFPKSRLPKETMKRLEKVRAALIGVLPKLEGVKLVSGRDGEFWSPRKMLRRALWHERDHTDHIRKLL